MQRSSAKFLAQSGVIAGLYVCLSLLVFPLASGAVQLRVGEALTLLPLLFGSAVPALLVGCIIVNLITGCVLIDIIVGSLVTLISAFLTYAIGRSIKNTFLKIFIGGLFPVLLNAFILPITWVLAGIGEYAYLLQATLIFVGQVLSVYGLGTFLYLGIRKKIRKE